MLKTRVIGAVLVKDGICVQSIGFGRFLPVGKPAIVVEHLNRWNVDEILLLDISAPRRGSTIAERLVAEVATSCSVPLAVGGGLRSVDDARRVISSGADRVVFNSAIVDVPAAITETAERFGSQAVIGAIDARPVADGSYHAFVRAGAVDTGIGPSELARTVQALGAGEVLIQAMHRDGEGKGCDLDLVRGVAESVTVPVIGLGGVGHPSHLAELATIAGVSGLAAGNYLHYTEHTALVAKAFLVRQSVPVRDESYANYRKFGFDADGRLAKRPDAELEEMMFVHYVDEKI
jgi:imidazole glycerol-phosphate synthase subunit HisF